MELAARIGMMAANGNVDWLSFFANILMYIPSGDLVFPVEITRLRQNALGGISSGRVCVTLPGIINTNNVHVTWAYPNGTGIVEFSLPNAEGPLVNLFTYYTKNLEVLRVKRITSFVSTSLRTDNNDRLNDIYVLGMSASEIRNVRGFPGMTPENNIGYSSTVFHGNDGRKVVYDEATSEWVVLDEVSTEGGVLNA